MKADIAKKWVAALRSGRYKQGYSTLHTLGGEYCCLGVLCDLAAQDGLGEWRAAGSLSVFVSDGGTKNANFLPVEVMEWAGMRSVSGSFRPDDIGQGYSDSKYVLSYQNDRGMPFSEIADLIDLHRERL